MNVLRFRIALMAFLASVSFAAPSAALADVGQAAEAAAAKPQASQTCPAPGDKKLNLAQAAQTECCKGNKGVCGCRAGKIVCCDSTASPNCTCHGEDGFQE